MSVSCPAAHARWRFPVVARWAMASLALSIVAANLLTSGCGVAPAPRYGRSNSSPNSSIARELETRRKAFHGEDESRLSRVVDGYLGVPYKWGGTTRQGMDCSALARAVIRETYGVELPRTSNQMYGLGSRVEKRTDLRPGDLVFFRIAYSGTGFSHVGVYVGQGRFAHASSSRGGVVDRLTQPYFDARYAGARRILP